MNERVHKEASKLPKESNKKSRKQINNDVCKQLCMYTV